MNWPKVSLRVLQIYCVLNVAIAIVGGGSLVLSGTEGLVRFADAEFQQSINRIDPVTRATFDNWYRLLGWYWLVTGLMLLWITPKVQYYGAWFRFIHVGFMAAGVANVGVLLSQESSTASVGALVPEFGIPALAILWQWWTERGARESPQRE